MMLCIDAVLQSNHVVVQSLEVCIYAESQAPVDNREQEKSAETLSLRAVTVTEVSGPRL